MEPQVIHLLEWICIVLFILLQKSNADQGTYKCSNFKCEISNARCQMRTKCILHGVNRVLNITNVKARSRSDSCSKIDVDVSFGHENDYVWTKCCNISATVCYKVESNISASGNNTTTQHSTTTEVANMLPNVTSEGGFDSTEMLQLEEYQDDDSSVENENVSFNGTVNAQTIVTESQTSNVVLKVALPVGVFVLVVLIAAFCFVFRRKVKGLVSQFREPCYKKPDQSNPVYGINGPASGNTTSDKFDNLTYAMQTGQEHVQPGNNPAGGYDYAKPMPHKKVGGQTNVNPSITVESSPMSKYRPEYEEVDLEKPSEMYDTTYQTLSGECCNTSYDHIKGSNAQAMTTPQAKFSGTAYDNAAI